MHRKLASFDWNFYGNDWIIIPSINLKSQKKAANLCKPQPESSGVNECLDLSASDWRGDATSSNCDRLFDKSRFVSIQYPFQKEFTVI